MRLRREMKKRRVTKEPYEGYTLPKSAEKGEPKTMSWSCSGTLLYDDCRYDPA
jgi:hypothetical protein